MLIAVNDLYKSYSASDAWLFPKRKTVLHGVSFEIAVGECVGLVGESGSGKSTLGKILLGLESYDAGTVTFAESLSQLPREQALSVVFQDYNTSVNPRMTMAEIIAEPLLNSALNKEEKRQLIERLLVEVGLSRGFMERYAHQLSGGQLQRVCIARAIAPNPRFIVLDEAVSSLDVSIQVQILELLMSLKQMRNIAYLFITHDIAVASFLCDRLLFFKDGRIVEQIECMEQLAQVQNPYTQRLLAAAHYLDTPFADDAAHEISCDESLSCR